MDHSGLSDPRFTDQQDARRRWTNQSLRQILNHVIDFKRGVEPLGGEVDGRLFERGFLLFLLARGGHYLLGSANVCVE